MSLAPHATFEMGFVSGPFARTGRATSTHRARLDDEAMLFQHGAAVDRVGIDSFTQRLFNGMFVQRATISPARQKCRPHDGLLAFVPRRRADFPTRSGIPPSQ